MPKPACAAHKANSRSGAALGTDTEGTAYASQAMPGCSHLDTVEFLDASENIAAREECLKIGGRWVHTRMCQSCDKIGCCDSSPNRHASAHHHESRRPVARSVQPGEGWSRCYPDKLMFRLRSS